LVRSKLHLPASVSTRGDRLILTVKSYGHFFARFGASPYGNLNSSLQHRVVSKWRGQRDSRLQGGESNGLSQNISFLKFVTIFLLTML
jgi:hypothetical protein